MSWASIVVGGMDLAASGMIFLDAGVLRAGLSVTELLGQEGYSCQVDSSGVSDVTFLSFFSSSMVTVSVRVVGASEYSQSVRSCIE